MSFFIVGKIDSRANESPQFLMDVIANATSYGQEDPQADDGSNTDIYLNISGDGMQQPNDVDGQGNVDGQDNIDGQGNDGEVYIKPPMISNI